MVKIVSIGTIKNVLPKNVVHNCRSKSFSSHLIVEVSSQPNCQCFIGLMDRTQTNKMKLCPCCCCFSRFNFILSQSDLRILFQVECISEPCISGIPHTRGHSKHSFVWFLKIANTHLVYLLNDVHDINFQQMYWRQSLGDRKLGLYICPC